MDENSTVTEHLNVYNTLVRKKEKNYFLCSYFQHISLCFYSNFDRESSLDAEVDYTSNVYPRCILLMDPATPKTRNTWKNVIMTSWVHFNGLGRIFLRSSICIERMIFNTKLCIYLKDFKIWIKRIWMFLDVNVNIENRDWKPHATKKTSFALDVSLHFFFYVL